MQSVAGPGLLRGVYRWGAFCMRRVYRSTITTPLGRWQGPSVATSTDQRQQAAPAAQFQMRCEVVAPRHAVSDVLGVGISLAAILRCAEGQEHKSNKVCHAERTRQRTTRPPRRPKSRNPCQHPAIQRGRTTKALYTVATQQQHSHRRCLRPSLQFLQRTRQVFNSQPTHQPSTDRTEDPAQTLLHFP